MVSWTVKNLRLCYENFKPKPFSRCKEENDHKKKHELYQNKITKPVVNLTIILLWVQWMRKDFLSLLLEKNILEPLFQSCYICYWYRSILVENTHPFTRSGFVRNFFLFLCLSNSALCNPFWVIVLFLGDMLIFLYVFELNLKT